MPTAKKRSRSRSAKSKKTHRYVYGFGAGRTDGRADMKALLGGKGANLAEMSRLGLPVPSGFTISTEVCTYYYDHQRRYPAELRGQVSEALHRGAHRSSAAGREEQPRGGALCAQVWGMQVVWGRCA